MKEKQGVFVAVVLVVLMIALNTNWFSVIGAELAAMSWWVYLVVAGVLFSGYKFISIAKKEHDFDRAWIEKEGEIYVQRMVEEKERRQQVTGKQYED